MLTIEEELVYLHTLEELNMADTEVNPVSVIGPLDSIAAIEARLTELERAVSRLTEIAGTVPREFVDDFKDLENVVHALAPIAHADHHEVVLPWLKKMAARIKAAL